MGEHGVVQSSGGAAVVVSCLLGYGLAMLHVLLQHSMEPDTRAALGMPIGAAHASSKPDASKCFSYYPPWSVDQQMYPMLVAAGGEQTPAADLVVGIPLLLEAGVGKSAFVGKQKDYPTSAAGCAGCGGCGGCG